VNLLRESRTQKEIAKVVIPEICILDFGGILNNTEEAAHYAFAQARSKSVICFAPVTNQIASVDGHIEKGEHNRRIDALKVIVAVVNPLMDDL